MSADGSGFFDPTRSLGGDRAASLTTSRTMRAKSALPDQTHVLTPAPELQLIYDTAPIGLAFLSCDCRYLHINQHLTEICGISVADHIGRSVRDTVPAVAEQVESIVQTILRTGEPITGVEVSGQRPDGSNGQRVWITYWHPLKNKDGTIAGINVAAQEITERKHAQAALAASEARFRELADNMSQFAWTADPIGRRIWFNKRWHDYAGTTLEEMKEWGWQTLHHPDHADRVLQRMRAAYAAEEPWEDTFQLRRRDGQYRWFLTRAVPIRDEGGEIIRWFGTNTDVTEQVELEKALRDLNENLEQRVEAEARERSRIWNVSQDLLVVGDAEGRIVSVNPAWNETLGWSEGELLGRPGEWLVHAGDREKSQRERISLVEGRKTEHFENRVRDKHGQYHLVSWRAVPHQGHIYAVGRDVTELRHAEEQLAASRRELARVSRQTAMGAMTASIAHEIKQPLAAIVMNANAGLRWLNGADLNLAELRAALEQIERDGHRTNEVIAGIRAMFGKGHLETAPVNMNALIKEVLTLMRRELDSHQVSLRTEMAEGLPEVLAERVQLQQVLVNLIINAIDSMNLETTQERRLTIKTELQDTAEVRISVEDSGSGIDPSHTDRIFDAFFTTKHNGMGMGLSICRSIVEAHRGRLWAAPRSPHGTIFYMQLPHNDGDG